jgi:hypothetical protein
LIKEPKNIDGEYQITKSQVLLWKKSFPFFQIREESLISLNALIYLFAPSIFPDLIRTTFTQSSIEV